MATPHISAPDGAFAKTVLMPGDPLRAKFIVDTYLEDVELVTSVRNIYGYTGTYKGKKVSVMASGMGMPSIGIYSYELYKFYGVENIIRIGSAGSYTERLKVLDVVLADSAFSESSYAYVQSGVKDDVLYPNKELNDQILATAEKIGIDCKTCRIHSSDVFYALGEMNELSTVLERSKAECVEMESFALFQNANVLGKRAACLLTISDTFVGHEELTPDERQTAMRQMMVLALESVE